jgi:GR25 family glycosyltransferase involved in LPS biosynthesis
VKAFVISLLGNQYSQERTARCIETAEKVGGIAVERFDAVDADFALAEMVRQGLQWTWAKANTAEAVCKYTRLKQRPYGRFLAKVGCSMSHFLLWQKCVQIGEPFMILEHDAVFERAYEPFEFRGICQINDPAGATPRGLWWHTRMRDRGPGVFDKTHIFPDDVPDGLAGNSAYVIHPHAAGDLCAMARRIGLWPNDALMCRQLFDLQELYPWITRVEQTVSTTS